MRVLPRLRSLCVILQLQVFKGVDAQMRLPKETQKGTECACKTQKRGTIFPGKMTITLKARAL